MVLLVGLLNQEVQTLEDNFGIKNLDDIATFDKDDFNFLPVILNIKNSIDPK
jgi:hypothetical protein